MFTSSQATHLPNWLKTSLTFYLIRTFRFAIGRLEIRLKKWGLRWKLLLGRFISWSWLGFCRRSRRGLLSIGLGMFSIDLVLDVRRRPAWLVLLALLFKLGILIDSNTILTYIHQLIDWLFTNWSISRIYIFLLYSS